MGNLNRREMILACAAALARPLPARAEPNPPDMINYWLLQIDEAIVPWEHAQIPFYAHELRLAIEAEGIPARYAELHTAVVRALAQ